MDSNQLNKSVSVSSVEHNRHYVCANFLYERHYYLRKAKFLRDFFRNVQSITVSSLERRVRVYHLRVFYPYRFDGFLPF